ncbi:hypothetical protein [Pseudomonas sp. NGC7]|uniref:hypothetical protein n=1 Tax=Pseudomonas sp. NGC7 TaxID=3341775 RepID=UPI0037DB2125
MNGAILSVSNELFTSWLYRQGAIPTDAGRSIDGLLEIYQSCMQRADFDPDFCLPSEFSNIALERLGVRGSDLSMFAPKSSWLIPRYYRGAFCYECFCDHIRSFKLPTMLTEWCSVIQTVCPIHIAPLLDTPGKQSYKLNMAVKIFSYYHAQTSPVEFPHRSLTPKVVGALLSVQAFMSSVEISASSGGNNSEWRLIQTIVRIFLYPRYGIIHSLFPRQSIGIDARLFRYNLNLGPLVSSVVRRQLAILLTGLIMDVLAEDERLAVEEYLQSFDRRHYFFDSAAGLGRSSNVFTPEHGSQLLTQLTELSTKIFSPYLTEFIAGFGGRGR